MHNSTSVNSQEIIEFKGSMTQIIQLVLKTDEISLIEAALQEKLNLSAQLIQGLPVVVDCSRLSPDSARPDYSALKALFSRLGIAAFGIKQLNPLDQDKARQAGFMPINDHRGQHETKSPKKLIEKKAQTMLIDKPVRSGQQIYAKGADLIITNNVGVGAEVMADGHIHIYGSLRGRALAGCSGNLQARIFASKAKAELVAIAGYYATAENMLDWQQDQALEIYLDGKQIGFKPIAG